jgi:plasmid stabilization system protein ParE
MNAAPGFELHPDAAQDILDIWEFIAVDNVAAAGRVRVDILESIRGFITFPHSGHRREDLTSAPLRFTRGSRLPDRVRAR